MSAEYWEAKYKGNGALWNFEPSEATLFTLNYFSKRKVSNILIPGVGYGRNAKVFIDSNFNVTGIEISKSAIDTARENNLTFPIFHGSVNDMPFEDKKYEGIFSHALIHLLGKEERKAFIKSCFNQLEAGGYMVFSAVSGKSQIFDNATKTDNNTFLLEGGLEIFCYDDEKIRKEFYNYGLHDYHSYEEPIKYEDGKTSLKFSLIICKKKF